MIRNYFTKGYERMDNRTGIVLEGGAMRCIFSAGILDFLLDKGIQIPNMLAVSAGAYTGMNYISGQRGRCIEAMVEPLREYQYLGLKTFLKKGTFFDMDYLFDEVPKGKAPFDFQTFHNFAGRFMTSIVNLEKGEALYLDEFETEERLFRVCKAANSMPFLAKVSYIDGIPVLDGGMADAIPIEKALEEGWEKIIVVLTRNAEYRKNEKSGLYMRALNMVYGKYPKFIELVRGRAKRYNDSLETIARLEKEGRVLVFRPTELTVENSEHDVERLKAYYQHGYDTAGQRYEELKRFLAD